MLIESDLFIASLKETDKLKAAAISIFEAISAGKINGAYASTAAAQEVIFWLLKENRSQDVLGVINALFNMRNVEWVNLNKEICLNAAALIEEYKLGAFDAYHAATAISMDNKIISSDHAYDRVKGIERLNPLSLA